MINLVRTNRHKSSLILLIWLWLLTGCQKPSESYHSFHPLNIEKGWKSKDTLSFVMMKMDSTQSYQVITEGRLATNFPYKELYLCISYRKAEKWENDTIHCDLSEQSSQVIHRGWAMREISFSPILVHPPHSGAYLIKVSQLMPGTTLPGVSDIGLHVTRLSSER